MFWNVVHKAGVISANGVAVTHPIYPGSYSVCQGATGWLMTNSKHGYELTCKVRLGVKICLLEY